MALVAKARAEAFEGRYFDRAKKPTLTVAQAWEAYKPISKRDNDTWQSEAGRAKQLIRILGPPLASGLTVKDVDSYRTQRMGETTKRKTPPSPGTLDREVELLKRILNYAVACSSLPTNPLAAVKLLRKPNVRRSVVSETDFGTLVQEAEDELKPILIVAYDTGMRMREVLDLRWSQVSLKDGVIKLSAEDTKTEEARTSPAAPSRRSGAFPGAWAATSRSSTRRPGSRGPTSARRSTAHARRRDSARSGSTTGGAAPSATHAGGECRSRW